MNNEKLCEQPCDDGACKSLRRIPIPKPMTHEEADDLLNMVGNGSFKLIRAVEKFHGIE